MNCKTIKYKTVIVIVFSCFVACLSNADEIELEWQNTFGSSGEEVGNSVQQTSDGGYIIAGVKESDVSGIYDAYLVKTNSIGQIEWDKTFGSSNNDGAQSVQQTSDGGYIIAGWTYSFGKDMDIYLVKADSNGNLEWEKAFDYTAYEDGRSVQQTFDGGYIIAGNTNLGGSDVYLVKTDSAGNLEWENTFGGSDHDIGQSVQQTSDGGYIIAGQTIFYEEENIDVYLIKTDSTGNLQWDKTFGGSNGDIAYSVQQTSDGGYVVAGETFSFEAEKNDVYLIKTDSSGQIDWEKTFGHGGNDECSSVIQTTDNGFVIAGTTESFGAGYDDIYLLKTDFYGNLQWEKAFGGTSYEWGESVQQTKDGGYIVAGTTTSYGAGSYDIYLVKVSGEGTIGDFCGSGFGPSDGYVDIWDLMSFSDHWDTSTSDSNWDSQFDLASNSFGDPDGVIDIWDLMTFADHWHEGVQP